MTTLKQIEANRRNARLSTGPRTPQGKAATRANGVRHGLTAQAEVLSPAVRSEIQAIADTLSSLHRPQSPQQKSCIDEMAIAFWRITRLTGGSVSCASERTRQRYRTAAGFVYRRALRNLCLLQEAA